MMKLYYLTDELVLVFCGPLGADGIYRFWRSVPGGWEFCPPRSTGWDWYRQRIARRREVEEIHDLPAGVPPLPDEFPPPVETHVLDREHETKTVKAGSRLYDAISRAGGSVEVHVLLNEDRYESLLGDGVYYDFETAFFDRAEAVAAACAIDATFGTEHTPGLDKRAAHLRTVMLTLRGDEVQIEAGGSEREEHDRYTRAEICDALTGRL